MRLGIIADLHANAPALAATLDALDQEGADGIIALGDLVGYNAMPHETLAMLREHRIPSVGGNHDLMATGRLPVAGCGPIARQAMEWTRDTLTSDEVRQLEALPDALRPGPRMLCVHATLGDPTRRLTSDDQVQREADRVNGQEAELAVCLMGHDHRPSIHTVGPKVTTTRHTEREFALPRSGFAFVNPGSVGYPRDGDPRAAYAMFDSQHWSVTLRHVDYDHRPVEDANARAGLEAASRAPSLTGVGNGSLARMRSAFRRFRRSSTAEPR